ncbi:MAG: hypothetical protein WAU24_10310 [Chitinophagaceae bacterium]
MSLSANKLNSINGLIDYVRNEKIKNQKISLDNEVLIINTIPLNYNLNSDYGLLVVSIFLIWNFQGDSNLRLAILVLLPISVICIWREFQYVNRTIIDFKNKKLTLINKNIIKKLIFNQQLLYFKEIDYFYYDEINLFNKGLVRFAILVKLKDGSSIKVTDFSRRKYAERILEYLNSFID